VSGPRLRILSSSQPTVVMTLCNPRRYGDDGDPSAGMEVDEAAGEWIVTEESEECLHSKFSLGRVGIGGLRESGTSSEAPF
jgi:hypothetical protein